MRVIEQWNDGVLEYWLAGFGCQVSGKHQKLSGSETRLFLTPETIIKLPSLQAPIYKIMMAQ